MALVAPSKAWTKRRGFAGTEKPGRGRLVAPGRVHCASTALQAGQAQVHGAPFPSTVRHAL